METSLAAARGAADGLRCELKSAEKRLAEQGGIGHNYIGHNYIGHNYVDHNCIGHNCIGHNYIGHICICHNCIGHNCICHNCIGHNYILDPAETRLAEQQRQQLDALSKKAGGAEKAALEQLEEARKEGAALQERFWKVEAQAAVELEELKGGAITR